MLPVFLATAFIIVLTSAYLLYKFMNFCKIQLAFKAVILAAVMSFFIIFAAWPLMRYIFVPYYLVIGICALVTACAATFYNKRLLSAAAPDTAAQQNLSEWEQEDSALENVKGENSDSEKIIIENLRYKSEHKALDDRFNELLAQITARTAAKHRQAELNEQIISDNKKAALSSSFSWAQTNQLLFALQNNIAAKKLTEQSKEQPLSAETVKAAEENTFATAVSDKSSSAAVQDNKLPVVLPENDSVKTMSEDTPAAHPPVCLPRTELQSVGLYLSNEEKAKTAALMDKTHSIDEVLNYVYAQNEKKEYALSLYALKYSLIRYGENDYAPFICIEASNIYKKFGALLQAAFILQRAVYLPAVREDEVMRQELTRQINYLRRLDSILADHFIAAVPFAEIPQNCLKQAQT